MKREIVAGVLVLLGLIIIAAGRVSSKKSLEANLPEETITSGYSEVSVSRELALWLLQEGRARLRAGRFDLAADTAAIAAIIDPNAGAGELTSSVVKKRDRLTKRLDAEAEDARAAGDAHRAARRAALSARSHAGGDQ